MKIAIVGSTQIKDGHNLSIVLHYMKTLPIGTQILTGSSLGVCKFVAENYPKRRKFSLRVYQPNWNQFKDDAVAIENRRMLAEAQIVAVCWNGVSMGSKLIIEEAKRDKKDLEIIDLVNESARILTKV